MSHVEDNAETTPKKKVGGVTGKGPIPGRSGYLDPRTENSAKTVRKRGNPDKTLPHRWKRGQSGNPGGRPSQKLITELFEELLADDAIIAEIKKAVRSIIRQKSSVTVQILREMADRVEGKPKETVEHNVNDNLAELLKLGWNNAKGESENV